MSVNIRPAANTELALPTAWHQQTEWENQVAYHQGHTAGYAAGYTQAQTEYIKALTQALGGTDCTNLTEAVNRHIRIINQNTTRAAHDQQTEAA